VLDSCRAFCWKYRNKKLCILSVLNVELINEIGIWDSAKFWISVKRNDFVGAANNSRNGCSRCLSYLS